MKFQTFSRNNSVECSSVMKGLQAVACYKQFSLVLIFYCFMTSPFHLNVSVRENMENSKQYY